LRQAWETEKMQKRITTELASTKILLADLVSRGVLDEATADKHMKECREAGNYGHNFRVQN